MTWKRIKKSLASVLQIYCGFLIGLILGTGVRPFIGGLLFVLTLLVLGLRQIVIGE